MKLPDKRLEWLTLAVGADKYALALILPDRRPVILGKVEEIGKKWNVKEATYYWRSEGQWKYLTKKIGSFDSKEKAMEFLADPEMIVKIANELIVRRLED